MQAAAAGYDFTVDWFSSHIPTWQRLLEPLAPRRLLEIGCYEGRSTVFTLEYCAAQRPIELHCVDTWDGGEEYRKGAFGGREVGDAEARFDANVALALARTAHPAQLVKHKAESRRVLVHLLAAGGGGQFDSIYIDGSHQAPDVLTDAVLGFELLRVGGLMIFDDYLWCMEPAGAQDALGMPKPAVDAFLNVFQRKMQAVPGCPLYQFYAHKTHP